MLGRVQQTMTCEVGKADIIWIEARARRRRSVVCGEWWVLWTAFACVNGGLVFSFIDCLF